MEQLDTSREENGFRYMLTRFIVLGGYVQVSIDIIPPEDCGVTDVALHMDDAVHTRYEIRNEPTMIRQYRPSPSAQSIFIDGLIKDTSEQKSEQPPDFSVTIESSGPALTLSRDVLFSTYPGNQNPTLRDFWSRVIAEPTGRFLEIGGRGQASAALRRQLPKGWDYQSVDLHPGDNVDIVADIHLLSQSVAPMSFDVIYSNSVMEHIFQPWLAVLECNKVLKPGGLMFTAAPNCWPRHAEPWDFWRFMDGAWPALFNDLSGFSIEGSSTYQEVKIVPVVMNANKPQLPGKSFRSWLGVCCLARKTGEPRQTWLYAGNSVGGTYPETAVLQKPPAVPVTP